MIDLTRRVTNNFNEADYFYRSICHDRWGWSYDLPGPCPAADSIYDRFSYLSTLVFVRFSCWVFPIRCPREDSVLTLYRDVFWVELVVAIINKNGFHHLTKWTTDPRCVGSWFEALGIRIVSRKKHMCGLLATIHYILDLGRSEFFHSYLHGILSTGDGIHVVHRRCLVVSARDYDACGLEQLWGGRSRISDTFWDMPGLDMISFSSCWDSRIYLWSVWFSEYAVLWDRRDVSYNGSVIHAIDW